MCNFKLKPVNIWCKFSVLNSMFWSLWKWFPISLQAIFSMTQLLLHIFAHLTWSSFRLKAKLLLGWYFCRFYIIFFFFFLFLFQVEAAWVVEVTILVMLGGLLLFVVVGPLETGNWIWSSGLTKFWRGLDFAFFIDL